MVQSVLAVCIVLERALLGRVHLDGLAGIHVVPPHLRYVHADLAYVFVGQSAQKCNVLVGLLELGGQDVDFGLEVVYLLGLGVLSPDRVVVDVRGFGCLRQRRHVVVLLVVGRRQAGYLMGGIKRIRYVFIFYSNI